MVGKFSSAHVKKTCVFRAQSGCLKAGPRSIGRFIEEDEVVVLRLLRLQRLLLAMM